MDRLEIRQRKILSIPKHHWSELSGPERLGLILVASIGLTGVLGAVVVAWWLALG